MIQEEVMSLAACLRGASAGLEEALEAAGCAAETEQLDAFLDKLGEYVDAEAMGTDPASALAALLGEAADALEESFGE